MLMWDAQTGENIRTLDAMKRACINTVLLHKNRLLSGTERRWNEEMNTVKVWSTHAFQVPWMTPDARINLLCP